MGSVFNDISIIHDQNKVAFSMVDNRWAMMKLVRHFINLAEATIE